MNIEALHIGMRVRHPQYGLGVVKAIATATADIQFNDILRTIAPEPSGLEPAEPRVSVQGLEMPLEQFIRTTVDATIGKLGLERPDAVLDQLAARWHGGKLVLNPANATQSKDLPIETFFHKIVMMRNNLRVLEQKVNGHEKLSDAEKIEMQQYITRCYGSMTTFNVLFREQVDQF